MARKKKDSVKIQPTFSKKQVELIQKFRGILGEDNAEIVRSIVINWLLENRGISTKSKND